MVMIIMKDFLLKVPTSLLDDIIGSYLNLKDVVNMDSAACSRTDRTHILNLLYCTAILHESSFLQHFLSKQTNLASVEGCDAMLTWLESRNAKLGMLWITNFRYFRADSWWQYLCRYGNFVTTLTCLLDANRYSYQSDGSNLTVQTLTNCCPNVTRLYCPSGLKPAEFKSIIDAWSNTLEELVLFSVSFEVLLSIGKSCQKLKRIKIYTKIGAHAEELPSFFQVCSTFLTHIDLTGNKCPDLLLLTIASRCPQLKKLVFSSSSCSDQGLTALATGCPLLGNIQFYRNNNISDVGVAAIVRNGYLVSIKLECLENVTDETVNMIVQCCKALCLIEIRKCPKVSDRAIEILRGFFSNVIVG